MVQHLSHDDVVPAFRHNLAFSHTPDGLGTGTVTVKDVLNGDQYSLRGFEYSLARLLDGKRTAHEVMENAAQLGIPITLLDLNGFVRKLADHHLVAEPGVDATDEVIARPFGIRATWDDDTRSLFRSALREGRAGNLNRAMLYLDCLTAEHDVPEATKLLERLEARATSERPPAPFAHVFAQAERDWQEDVITEKVELPREKKKWIGIGAAVAALAIGLGVAFIPWPHTVLRLATLAPVVSGKVTAPRTGTVATVEVEAGRWVEQDTVLFTYDVTEELTQLEAAVDRLSRLNTSISANLPATAEVRAARNRLQKAETALTIAESNPTDPTLHVALEEIANAQAALDAFVPDGQAEELRAQREQVQALEMQVLDSEVKAPVSGAVTALGVRPGQELVRGDETVTIDDTRQLKATARIGNRDQASLAPGQDVIVISHGRATQARVTRARDGVVEVLVDNSGQVFEPGAAQLQIRAKPTPLVRPISTF